MIVFSANALQIRRRADLTRRDGDGRERIIFALASRHHSANIERIDIYIQIAFAQTHQRVATRQGIKRAGRLIVLQQLGRLHVVRADHYPRRSDIRHLCGSP